MRFEQEFQAALAMANAGDNQQALTACSRLLLVRPDDPAVLQLQATISLRTGDPAAALGTILRSLVRRPGHVPSLILAGQAALALQAFDRAVEPLRQAVALAPDRAEPAFLLCHALLGLGDPGLPATLQATAAKHPAPAALWQKLGAALHRAQRPQETLTAFTLAAAAIPALAEAQFGLGISLREFGRMTEAAVALRRAVQADPTAHAAWFALGLTCQDLDDEAGAAAAFQAALDQRPDLAEAAVNLGIARQRLGDMAAALQAYRTAVRIRPDTLGRIAQAVTSARTGMLWLDLGGLHRALGV
jgi:tetratricopeptide (TPR) repeat protein